MLQVCAHITPLRISRSIARFSRKHHRCIYWGRLHWKESCLSWNCCCQKSLIVSDLSWSSPVYPKTRTPARQWLSCEKHTYNTHKVKIQWQGQVWTEHNKRKHTDGEAVIMLAFQASGRGSTPLQCIIFFIRPMHTKGCCTIITLKSPALERTHKWCSRCVFSLVWGQLLFRHKK